MSENNFQSISGGTMIGSTTFNIDTTGNATAQVYFVAEWEPYNIPKYKPKFHIELGYKNQMKDMWK